MLKRPKYWTLFHTMIPQPVQNSESVVMDMFLPVVSTENDDNEITIILVIETMAQNLLC